MNGLKGFMYENDAMTINSNLVLRALRSLTNVYVEPKKLDILYKSVTCLNLLKKFISAKLPLTVWAFHDCVAQCNFNGELYRFYLAKQGDFNIYLNPYFHEYDVAQFVFSSLKSGDVMLDVGAHGGLYTLIAGKKIGSQGKVISFEPNPSNVSFLKLNIELNKLTNIVLIPKAVADKPCKIELFYAANKTALTSALRREEECVVVEATTIDDAT